ncbi:marvel domain-containing protein [Mariannaea sp. PMI_226]|nr:marvel domain-containing protein [Mariannaea sp. PMI_226]
MTLYMTENKTLDYALRTAQLIFAIIVMGTDGYAIHVFHGHSTITHTPIGNFHGYFGVPNEWGFLMFCAGWAILTVIFQLIAGITFTNNALIAYSRVTIEAVAVLSWLAGFIAVAVEIPTNTCSQSKSSCGSLITATVFGAFGWLLFMITAALTAMPVFHNSRKPKASTIGPNKNL